MRYGSADDFFDIGGDSLKRLLVPARISTELEAGLPVTEIFRHPTAEALARRPADGTEADDNAEGEASVSRTAGRGRLARARALRAAPTQSEDQS